MTPAKPTHTPPRSIRIEDGLWQAAQQAAAGRGETVSEVIRRALQRYVNRDTNRERTTS